MHASVCVCVCIQTKGAKKEDQYKYLSTSKLT